VEQEEQQALAILRGGFYPGPPAQPSQSRASKAIAGPLLSLLACPGRGTQSPSLLARSLLSGLRCAGSRAVGAPPGSGSAGRVRERVCHGHVQ